MGAFSFPLSENICISFLKDIYMGCRILSWQFSFWSACLLSEICREIFILLLGTCHLSLSAFKISLFPLVFSVRLWWFHLDLSCLMFPELLASVNLCLSLNLGNILSLFLQKRFSIPISFSSQGLWAHGRYTFLYCSPGPEAPLVFNLFSVCSSCLFFN